MMITERTEGTLTATNSETSINAGASTSRNVISSSAVSLSSALPYNTEITLKSHQANLQAQDAAWMRNNRENNTSFSFKGYPEPRAPESFSQPQTSYKFPDLVPPSMPGPLAIHRTLYNQKYIEDLPRYKAALGAEKNPKYSMSIAKISDILNKKEEIQKQLKKNASKASKLYLRYFNHAVRNIDDAEFQQLLGNIGAICHPVGPDFDVLSILKPIQNYLNSSPATLFSAQFWSYLYGHRELAPYLNQTTLGQAIVEDIKTMAELFFEQLNDISAGREYTPICHEKQAEILEIIQAFCISREGINPHSFCKIDLSDKNAEETIAALLKNEGVISLLNESGYGQKLLKQLKRYPTFIKLIEANRTIEHIDNKISEKENQIHALRNQRNIRRLFNSWGISRRDSEIKSLKKSKAFKNTFGKERIISEQSEIGVIQRIQQEGVDATLRWLLDQDEDLQNNVSSLINLQSCTEQVTPTALADPQKCASFVSLTIRLSVCDELRNSILLDDDTFYQAMVKFHHDVAKLTEVFDRNNIDQQQQALLFASGALLPHDLSRGRRQSQMVNLLKFINGRNRLPGYSPDLPVEEYLADSKEWLAANAKNSHRRMVYDIVQWQLLYEKDRDFYDQLRQSLKKNLDKVNLAQNYRRGIWVDNNEINHLLTKIIKNFRPELDIDQSKENIKATMFNSMLSQKKFAEEGIRQAWFNLELAKKLGLWSDKLVADLSEVGLTNQHFKDHHTESPDKLINKPMIDRTDHLIVLEKILTDLLVTRRSLSTLENYFREMEGYQQQTEMVNTLVTLMENTLFTDAERLIQFREQISMMFSNTVITHFTERRFEQRVLDETDTLDAEAFTEALLIVHKNLLSFSPNDIHNFFDNVNQAQSNPSPDLKKELLESIRSALFDDYNNQQGTTCTILSLLLHKMFSTDCIGDLPEETVSGQSHQLLNALSNRLLLQMSGLIDKETGKILAPWSGPLDTMKTINHNTKAACHFIGNIKYNTQFSSKVADCLNDASHSDSAKKLTESEILKLKDALHQHYLHGSEDTDEFVDGFITLIRKQRNKQAMQYLSQAVNDYHFFLSLRNRCKDTLSSREVNEIKQKIIDRATAHSNPYFKDELGSATARPDNASTSGDNNTSAGGNTSPGGNTSSEDRDRSSGDNKPGFPEAQSFVNNVDQKHNISDSLMYKINQFSGDIYQALQVRNADEADNAKKARTEDVLLALAQLQSINHIVGEFGARLTSRQKVARDEIQQQNRKIEQDNYYYERERKNQLIQSAFEFEAVNREITQSNASIKKLNKLKSELGTPFSRYLAKINFEKPVYMVFEAEDDDYETRVVARKADGPVTEHVTLDGNIKRNPYHKTRYDVPIHPNEYSEKKQQEVLAKLQSQLDKNNASSDFVPAQESWTYHQSGQDVPVINNHKLVKVGIREKRPTKLKFVGVERFRSAPAPVNPTPPDIDLKKSTQELVDKYKNNPEDIRPAHKVIRYARLPLDYYDTTTAMEAAAFPAVSLPTAPQQSSSRPSAATLPLSIPPAPRQFASRPSAAAIPLSMPPAPRQSASQPSAATVPAFRPVSLPQAAPRSTPIALGAGPAGVGLSAKSAAEQNEAEIAKERNEAEIAALFAAAKPNPVRYHDKSTMQKPAGLATTLSPAGFQPVPNLQPFRHLLDTLPENPTASSPAQSTRTGVPTAVIRNQQAQSAKARLTPDDSFGESTFLAAQSPDTVEITAANFKPKMLKPDSIEEYISPAREFRIIENDAYATNTGHANCLLNSMAMHFYHDYNPDSARNLALVKGLRARLQKQWQGNIPGGFGADGYMSTNSGSCKAALDFLNRKLQSTGQPEMRVIFHDYVKVGLNYVEMIEAIGPVSGREVHILQHQAHFMALVKS